MEQAIGIFVINLARRPDRLERIGDHLKSRGVTWQRTEAIDATEVSDAYLDERVSDTGPLGRFGRGDRTATVSHMAAWQDFLKSGLAYGLIVEDDAYFSTDLADLLADDAWIPEGIEVIKLEKFGEGTSRVLLGRRTELPVAGRAAFELQSRHVGGAAYILSRKAAQAGLDMAGRVHVPVDHLWFNPNVSPLARRFRPVMVHPAMATQRAYAYNSDIAHLGKAAAPTGLGLKWRKLKRGFYEIWLLPKQLLLLALGRAKLQDVAFAEEPPGAKP